MKKSKVIMIYFILLLVVILLAAAYIFINNKPCSTISNGIEINEDLNTTIHS